MAETSVTALSSADAIKIAIEKEKAKAAQLEQAAKKAANITLVDQDKLGENVDSVSFTASQTAESVELEPKPEEKISDKKKEWDSLSDAQKEARIQKWADACRADASRLGELADEPVMKEWRAKTNGRANVDKLWKQLKESGLSSEEIGEKFKEAELKCIEEDTKYLQEQFEKNPELRTKLQENFDKLSRSEQKALLNEFYKSDRKGGVTEEVQRLMNGLKTSSDEVKSLAVAALRNNKNVTKEQYQNVLKELGIMEKDVVNRLPKISAPEQVLVTGNVMKDKTSVARTDLAKQIPHCDQENIPYMTKTFTQSEHIKNDETAKSAYIETLKEYDDENQVIAAKYGIDSDNFNSQNRDKIIGEIKNFGNSENQKTVANYATDSDKVDENNRVTLAKEIKNFDKDVQSDVARHFSESDKNTSSEKVMNEFKKEINNLKIKEEEKAALQKSIEQKQAAEAKRKAEEQQKAEAKASEEKRKEEAALKEQEALAQQAAKNSQIGDEGLAKLIQAKMQMQSTNIFAAAAQARPTSFSDLTNCINSGKITFNEMKAEGYEKYAIACMNDLNADKQEELLASVDTKTIAYMHQRGLLPSRLNKQVLARISSATTDSYTVRYAANQADNSNDIRAMFEAQSVARNKEEIKEVWKKRYSESYEEYMKKHNDGFGSFSSLA